MDYERLKVALLERYEGGYREKFREARPEEHESQVSLYSG